MSIEAMKQIAVALRALMTGYMGDAEDAIAALEAELAKPEQVEYDKLTVKFGERAKEYLEAAKKSWEQEPVAWRNAAIRLGEDLYSVGPNGYYDMTAKQWLDWALSVVNTAPPRKPWVGLTDDELMIIKDCNRGFWVNAAKIEQLLKDKNT